MAEPEARKSLSRQLAPESTREDRGPMLAVPKAQFRLGIDPPSDHPHLSRQGADALVP